MKNFNYQLIAILFVALTFPQFGFSQDSFIDEPDYEVNRVFPYISVTKEKLKEAQTLIDLNDRYKPSWVRTYISVEISASHDGKLKKVANKSDTLSQKQKELMLMADANTDISVAVQYIPENTLKQNDPKETTFTFAVDPDKEATFVGGSVQLKEYLRKKAMDNIPEDTFINYDLVAVQFSINEDGEVVDARLYDTSMYNSSRYNSVSRLLLKTIQTMPCWKPAEYANGLKVKQDFVLTVGNMESCVVNLLNIRHLPPE